MTLNYKPEAQSPSKLACALVEVKQTSGCLPFWQAPYTEKEKKNNLCFYSQLVMTC